MTALLKEGHSQYPHSISLLLLLNNSPCIKDNEKSNCISKICLIYPNEIVEMFKKAQNLYLNKELLHAEDIATIGIEVCKLLNLPLFNEVYSEFLYLKGNIYHCHKFWPISRINYVNAVMVNKSNLTFRIAAI